jgi:hypothetical protein
MKMYKKPTFISSNVLIKGHSNEILPLAAIGAAIAAEGIAAAALAGVMAGMASRVDFAVSKERLIPAI